jgi:chromatin remodeling complex protein RSC6
MDDFLSIRTNKEIEMATKQKKPSAFMKPVSVSSELAEVVGKGPMARTEVTKKLWDYIKKNKLQDPKNKRNIKPDQKLAKVFGSPAAIDMFKMTSKVSKHLTDAELSAK